MQTSLARTIDDKRTAAMAAVVVAAVVLVIGFGSGIGSVLRRSAASTAASAQLGRGGSATPLQTVGSVDLARSFASAVGSTAPSLRGITTPTHRARLAEKSTENGTAKPCAGEPLTTAMLSPFVVHFNAAHLETSPGQQVSDATNVDQYTKTHTVMIKAMWMPLVDLVLALPSAIDPFVVHFYAAHLETSPGQQVSDATNVDQYTKTHTVMIENMLDPVGTGLTASGC